MLVALVWSAHRRHAEVRQWFNGAVCDGWASCAITQIGAARVLSLPAVTYGTLTPVAATELVTSALRDAQHRLWPCNIGMDHPLFLAGAPHLQGHNQLTDLYLLALAAANDGVLATLDHGIAAGRPAGSPLLRHLEVIRA